MAEYNTLKETIQSSVIARPFTRIPGKPSWEEKENLLEEAEEMALEMEVSYDSSNRYGLLAGVQGAAKYLVTLGLAYVAPVRPDVNDARINALPPPSQARIGVIKGENDEAKKNFAVLEGFRLRFGDNIRGCLDANYYAQLWEIYSSIEEYYQMPTSPI